MQSQNIHWQKNTLVAEKELPPFLPLSLLLYNFSLPFYLYRWITCNASVRVFQRVVVKMVTFCLPHLSPFCLPPVSFYHTEGDVYVGEVKGRQILDNNFTCCWRALLAFCILLFFCFPCCWHALLALSVHLCTHTHTHIVSWPPSLPLALWYTYAPTPPKQNTGKYNFWTRAYSGTVTHHHFNADWLPTAPGQYTYCPTATRYSTSSLNRNWLVSVGRPSSYFLLQKIKISGLVCISRVSV
jgi:hypothetical protein